LGVLQTAQQPAQRLNPISIGVLMDQRKPDFAGPRNQRRLLRRPLLPDQPSDSYPPILKFL
jgi:hypothetical protein